MKRYLILRKKRKDNNVISEGKYSPPKEDVYDYDFAVGDSAREAWELSTFRNTMFGELIFYRI